MTWGWRQRTCDPRAMNFPGPDQNPWYNNQVPQMLASPLEGNQCFLPQILTFSQGAILRGDLWVQGGDDWNFVRSNLRRA